MNNSTQLETEKKQIIKEISKIDSMRKGTISEQYIKTLLNDGSVKENGPYYILTSKDSKGKTVSESIPKGKLEFFKHEIEKYKKFNELAEKYEILSEESSKIKSDNSQAAEKLKKNKRSKSSSSLN